MNFSKKTLSKEFLPELHTMQIKDLQPFVPMMGPTYVFLKAHEKLLAIKRPLDFFVPLELEKLKSYENVYFQKSFKDAIDFQNAGIEVRKILLRINTAKKITSTELLHPSPIEASQWILHILGPLWWIDPKEGGQIEYFFVTMFINGICGPFPEKTIIKSREMHTEEIDKAIYISSCVSFLALHIGYYHLEFLTDLRNNIFDSTLSNTRYVTSPPEINELIQKVTYLFKEKPIIKLTHYSLFSEENIFQKLKSKFTNIQKNLISKEIERPTIYGKNGFIDVDY